MAAAAEFPGVQIERSSAEGHGVVTYTFVPGVLQETLGMFGVREPGDLPESVLRTLCRKASQSEIADHMKKMEEQNPGSAVAVIGQPGTEVWAADVGVDMVLRLISDQTKIDLLCDPDLSPVELDIRVFDDQPTWTDSSQNIGHSVLRVMLRPQESEPPSPA